MIKYNNTNNASTTLTAGISPSSTTLIVENGDILPTAPFLLTLEHFDNEKVTVREIVKCIAKVGTILTVQRGAGTCVQDDSATPKAQNNTPHSFSVGDCASIYWTSEQVQDIQNEIEKKLNIDDFQAGTYVYGATSTGTDAYSITIPGTLTSYSVGQVFRFMADTENTGNATLNVNGIGEKEILKNHDQHLQSGDIEAGQIVEVAYDGTNFQMDSQIASVISLDDISSLSYNDATCYAGEEIHENDLIVTNGNSFNPDRTDESTDVGGQTVNKYAIGFIGNGESTDTFSIKTSVIEGSEPDSVTINIETDDNGKPSGTVLATSDSLNVFKIRTDPNAITTSGISGLDAWYMNTLGKGEGKISYDSSSRIMTISGNLYNYTLDFSSLLTSSNVLLKSKTSDDKYFMFGFANNDNFWLVNLPNPKTIEGANVQAIDASIINTASGVINARLYDLCITDNGKYMFACISSGSNNIAKVFKVTLTTPFVVNSYDAVTEQTTGSVYYRSNFSIIKNFGKEYLCRSRYVSTLAKQYAILGELDTDYTITNYYSSGSFAQTKIHPDYREFPARFYGGDNELLFGYGRNYDGIYKVTITTTSVLNTVNGTKYWLTIAPARTGSVVNCAVVYDKEGEYHSELAVRDLNNWSNVSNKTPYIDATCIKARYARKANENDKLEEIPFGFANGDFTELESVQYTFQGLKTGFSDLTTDSLYYSDGNGGITSTIGQYVVGKSTDSNSLLVQFTPFVQIIAGKQYTLKSGTGSFTVEQTGDYLIEMHWGGSNNRDSGVKITNSSDEIIYTASTNNDSRVYRFTPGTYTITKTGDWGDAGILTSTITYTKIPYNL